MAAIPGQIKININLDQYAPQKCKSCGGTTFKTLFQLKVVPGSHIPGFSHEQTHTQPIPVWICAAGDCGAEHKPAVMPEDMEIKSRIIPVSNRRQ